MTISKNSPTKFRNKDRENEAKKVSKDRSAKATTRQNEDSTRGGRSKAQDGDVDGKIPFIFEEVEKDSAIHVVGTPKEPTLLIKPRSTNGVIRILTGKDPKLERIASMVEEMLCLRSIDSSTEHLKPAWLKVKVIKSVRCSRTYVVDMVNICHDLFEKNVIKEDNIYWLSRGDEKQKMKLYELTTIMEMYPREKVKFMDPDKDTEDLTHPCLKIGALLYFHIAKIYWNLNCYKYDSEIRHLLVRALCVIKIHAYPKVHCQSMLMLSGVYLPLNTSFGDIRVLSTHPESENFMKRISSAQYYAICGLKLLSEIDICSLPTFEVELIERSQKGAKKSNREIKEGATAEVTDDDFGARIGIITGNSFEGGSGLAEEVGFTVDEREKFKKENESSLEEMRTSTPNELSVKSEGNEETLPGNLGSQSNLKKSGSDVIPEKSNVKELGVGNNQNTDLRESSTGGLNACSEETELTNTTITNRTDEELESLAKEIKTWESRLIGSVEKSISNLFKDKNQNSSQRVSENATNSNGQGQENLIESLSLYKKKFKRDRLNMTDPSLEDISFSFDSEGDAREYIIDTLNLEVYEVMDTEDLNNTIEEELNSKKIEKDFVPEWGESRDSLPADDDSVSSVSENEPEDIVDTIPKTAVTSVVWSNLTWGQKLVYKLIRKLFLILILKARNKLQRGQYLLSLKNVELALSSWVIMCHYKVFSGELPSIPYLVSGEVYRQLSSLSQAQKKKLIKNEDNSDIISVIKSCIPSKDPTVSMPMGKCNYENLLLSYMSYKNASRVFKPLTETVILVKFMQVCYHICMEFLDMIEDDNRLTYIELKHYWIAFMEPLAYINYLQRQERVISRLNKIDHVKLSALRGRFRILYSVARFKAIGQDCFDLRTRSNYHTGILDYETALRYAPPSTRDSTVYAKRLLWQYGCALHKYYLAYEHFYRLGQLPVVIGKDRTEHKPITYVLLMAKKCLGVARMRHVHNKAWLVLSQDVSLRLARLVYEEYRKSGDLEFLILAEHYWKSALKLLIRMHAHPLTIVFNATFYLYILHLMHILAQDIGDKWEFSLMMMNTLVQTSNAVMMLIKRQSEPEAPTNFERMLATSDPTMRTIITWTNIERAKSVMMSRWELGQYANIMMTCIMRFYNMATFLSRFRAFRREAKEIKETILSYKGVHPTMYMVSILMKIRKMYPFIRMKSKKKNPGEKHRHGSE